MEHYSLEDSPLDFDDFANALLEQGAEQSPSQIHGGICGVFSAGASSDGGSQDAEYGLAAVAQALHMDIHGELAVLCLRLAGVTLAALRDEEFDFHLFLPDDEEEIELRVAAMSQWCSGFLSGFALLVASPEGGALSEDSAEILKDISAIAEADVDIEDDATEGDEDEEEAESHFFELGEYLRFATLNLYLDQPDRAESAGE
jgi:uncharacterized protein YgfB (UPF0149 family)